jgi:hypothetical protein
MCIPLGPDEPSPHKPLPGPLSMPPPGAKGRVTDRICAPQPLPTVAMSAIAGTAILPSRRFNLLADLLGQSDEDALGASDVTEPILILVLRQFTNQLGSVRAEPGERVVDVLHGEHDA